MGDGVVTRSARNPCLATPATARCGRANCAQVSARGDSSCPVARSSHDPRTGRRNAKAAKWRPSRPADETTGGIGDDPIASGWPRRPACVRHNGDVESLKGKLLLASPVLEDPNFARTVVLVA